MFAAFGAASAAARARAVAFGARRRRLVPRAPPPRPPARALGGGARGVQCRLRARRLLDERGWSAFRWLRVRRRRFGAFAFSNGVFSSRSRAALPYDEVSARRVSRRIVSVSRARAFPFARRGCLDSLFKFGFSCRGSASCCRSTSASDFAASFQSRGSPRVSPAVSASRVFFRAPFARDRRLSGGGVLRAARPPRLAQRAASLLSIRQARVRAFRAAAFPSPRAPPVAAPASSDRCRPSASLSARRAALAARAERSDSSRSPSRLPRLWSPPTRRPRRVTREPPRLSPRLCLLDGKVALAARSFLGFQLEARRLGRASASRARVCSSTARSASSAPPRARL